MGGATSKFDKHNWQFERRAGNTSNFDIVRDDRTGMHAERHVIHNNPTISDEEQMQVYQYRNQTNKPIVKVYDAEYVKGKSGGGACGAAKDIIVHSQYIPYRLSDTRNLNHGQALYVLSQALAGFHQLHHRFGPFEITNDHIGFNQIGQAKVWHSQNFATNHLNRDNIVLMSTKNPKNFDQRMQRRYQQEMVEDIWSAVDQHANISPNFTAKANYFREKGFVQARRLVNEEIGRGATYVPDYLSFRNDGFGSGQNQLINNQSVVSNYQDFKNPNYNSQYLPPNQPIGNQSGIINPHPQVVVNNGRRDDSY